MPRRTIIKLAVFGALVLGLYLTGAVSGARKPAAVSCGGGGPFAPRHVAPSELKGIEQCSVGQTLRVQSLRPCALTAEATSSWRPRVLSINLPAKGLHARVNPNGHPERAVDADLDAGATDLPLDRDGASVVFTCAQLTGCVATIVK